MEFPQQGKWIWLPKGRRASKEDWEGEVKKEVDLENKFSWMQEESFKKIRSCDDTR